MLYPILTASRELFDLNGVWAFKLDHGAGFDEEWFRRPLAETVPMPVPASYNDVYEGAEFRDHIGWVWYEREFVLPEDVFSQRIVLRFGSVTHEARVYMNGQLATEHKGGFTPFEAEINQFVHHSRNRLTVAVNNVVDYTTLPVGTYRDEEVPGLGRMVTDTPNFDFFNYAGIQRPVRLYTTPQTYIRDITVQADVTGSSARIAYQVDAVGDAEIRVFVHDETDEVVASGTGPNSQLVIEGVHLWQPLHAYLYTCVVELWRDGQRLDVYEEPFGVRTVAVSDGKFLINGEPFYFKGFGKHEDAAVRGKAHDNVFMVHDFALMEWLGANSFRTSHYPYAEEVLDYADRQGVVVIDETPAVGINSGLAGGVFGAKPFVTFSPETIGPATQNAHRQVIRELIARDKNHPCVVIWSIANEPESVTPASRDYFEPLIAEARHLDPTRPVGFANVQGAEPDVDVVTDLCDVVMLNRYYGWYIDAGDLAAAERKLQDELDAWVAKHDKPIIMTEYGADTLPGQHGVFPGPWSEEYQVAVLEMSHRVFDRVDAVIGEQIWNFADFATAPGILRVGGNRKGVFTRDRAPKAAALALRRRWREQS